MNNAETEEEKRTATHPGDSRAGRFSKGLGTTAVTTVAAQTAAVAEEIEKANAEKIIGPGAVPVALTGVNGQKAQADA